jgi:hypothetical protein
MSFIAACLLYALVGSLIGVVAHLFNGVVQSHIDFNTKYLKSIVLNFAKVSFVWIGTVILTSGFILLFPDTLLRLINTDQAFLHGLVYYLYAFAAFDFTLKNVVEHKDSLTLRS